MARLAGKRLGSKLELLLVVAVTAVGAAFRFWHLGGQSFWYDEVVSARIVRSSFGGMLHGIWRTESTPPLYYVLGWIWVRIAGHSETALRSLSAVAGTAAIPATYFVGRRLITRAAGLLAAAFVALSPFLIWYSQEARAYSLFVLLGVLSLWAFASASARPARTPPALWAGVSILVLAGLLLLTVALLAATSSEADRRGALVVAGVGLAVVVGPLLAAALGEDFWLFRNLIVAWIPFVLVLSTALTGRAGPRTVAVGAAAIAVALVAAEGVLAVRLVRWQVPIRDDWRGFAHCLAQTPGSRLLVVVPAHNAIALSYYRPSVQPAGTADTVSEIIFVGRSTPSVPPPRGFRRTDFTCSSGIRVLAYRSPLPRRVRPARIGPSDSLFLDRRVD